MSDVLEKPTLGEAGIWERRLPDVAGRIAAATPAANVSIAAMARSVPSIWGYVRFFAHAFGNREHVLHEPVTELWRRFVCLIALRDVVPGQAIKLSPIVIPALPDGSAGDDAAAEIGLDFKSVAALQFPHEVLGTRRHESITVIAALHRGQAIGLLLPGLMAIPGRSLIEQATRPPSLEQLFPLERLRMPSNERSYFYRDYLTPSRLRLLAGFLSEAKEEGRKWLEARGDSRLSILVERLSTFEADVRAGLDGNEPSVWRGSEADIPQRISERSAIRLFAFRADERAVPTRAVIPLRAAAELRGEGVPELALVTKGIVDPDYRGLSVDGVRIVDDLIDRPLDSRLRESLERLLIVGADDIFEPSLIRLPAAESYPKHGKEFERFLIPIRPLMLAAFEPSELLSRLRIEGIPSDSEVKVALRLSVGQPVPRSWEIIRTYRVGSEEFPLVDAVPPTSFAIWPDFAVREAAQPGTRMPTLIFQGLETAAESSNPDASSAPSLRATGLVSLAELGNGLRRLTTEASLRARPPRLPERARAAVLSETLRQRHELFAEWDAVEAVRFSVGEAAGLALVHDRVSMDAADGGLTCTVAIDFGTTNTTLAFTFGANRPETRLESHVWLPFHESEVRSVYEAGGRLDLQFSYLGTAANFIPPRPDVPLPFQSLLQVRTRINTDDETPLLRCRIPFPLLGNNLTDVVRLTDMICRPPPGTVIEASLKWAGGTDRRRDVQHLLREVMILAIGHTRVRGVPPDRITWKLSRPRSLPRDVMSRFEEDVKHALKGAMGGVEPTAASIRFVWESQAIYSYLIRQQIEGAAAPSLAILDIGGRSTDIAMLKQGGLLADGSAQIAGRALLVEHWAQQWQAFREWLLPLMPTLEPDDLPENVSEDGKIPIIESLMNEATFEAVLKERCDTMATDPILNLAQRRTQLGFLGLLYFLVHFAFAPLLGQLDPAAPVAVFLCGRGSLIFRRFCMEPDAERMIWSDVVENWLQQVGFINPGFRVTFSNNPKQEVAIGALWPLADALPAKGVSEAQTLFTNSISFSPATDPAVAGTLLHFCREIQPLFGRAFPALDDVEAMDRALEGQIYFAMGHPDAHPGFAGFGDLGTAPEQVDARRRFILGLEALLRTCTRS
jgi:hypothetical protein